MTTSISPAERTADLPVHPERSRRAHLVHFTLVALLAVAPTAALADPPVPTSPTLSATTDAERAFLAVRKPTSLKDVLALTEKNSKDLAAAKSSADQVIAKARLVYSAILPEISVSGTYVRTSAPQVFDMSAFGQLFAGSIAAAMQGTGGAYAGNWAGPNPVPQANQQAVDAVTSAFTNALGDKLGKTTIVAQDSVYGTLLIQQILFTPQFFLFPAAGEAADAARYGSLEAREQILLGVSRLYLGIEGLAQIEQAAHDAEQVALKRERDAKAQQAAGMATDIAVLRAQSDTAQARATLANLSGQRIALLALLEALVGSPVRPVDGEPTKFEVTAGAENDSPWDKTWMIRATSMALTSQERFNTFDRLSWMPTLVAQAKGSYNSNKGFANTNFILDGIISAQWTLYDRGVRYATMHENDAKTAELRAKLDGAKEKARATWIGAKANLETAQVALEQADAQFALATRAQKQIESAYQAGFTTNLEVTDIDNKRFFAQSAAAQAHAQLEIRKVELAAAEGRLAEAMGLVREPQ